MRWPFGPPHLTLQPSKKSNKKNKKNPIKTQKHKHTPKRAFQLSVKYFFYFWWVSKISLLLTTWPKKRAPKKRYKNRGFSKAFFEKQMRGTKRPFFGPKKPKPEIPVIIFFGLFFSSTTVKHNNWLKPYFYCALANLKEAMFRKLADNWTQKQNDN